MPEVPCKSCHTPSGCCHPHAPPNTSSSVSVNRTVAAPPLPSLSMLEAGSSAGSLNPSPLLHSATVLKQGGKAQLDKEAGRSSDAELLSACRAALCCFISKHTEAEQRGKGANGQQMKQPRDGQWAQGDACTQGVPSLLLSRPCYCKTNIVQGSSAPFGSCKSQAKIGIALPILIFCKTCDF